MTQEDVQDCFKCWFPSGTCSPAKRSFGLWQTKAIERETVPIGYNFIVARSVLNRYGRLGYKWYLGRSIFIKNDMRKFKNGVVTGGSGCFLSAAPELLYF